MDRPPPPTLPPCTPSHSPPPRAPPPSPSPFFSQLCDHELLYSPPIEYNALFHSFFGKPPPFQLPKLEDLHIPPSSSPLFFTKLDLSNCFWSIRLPSQVRGSFVLQSPTGPLCTRQLPFGWSWSPFLAHTYIHDLLRPLRLLLPSTRQYIDDILLAHTDPCFLRFCTLFAVSFLEKAAFS